MLASCSPSNAPIHSLPYPTPKPQNWLYIQSFTQTNLRCASRPSTQFLISCLRLHSPKSSIRPGSESVYHIRPTLFSQFSQLCVSRHPQATRPTQLLTYLRGVQPQFTNHQDINYGEGKLNPFQHSLKFLNVFNFWIYFLIL